MDMNSQPVEKGHPTLRIALSADAYLRIMEAARTRLPVETFGALVGRKGVADRNGQEWSVVEAAMPVRLLPSGAGLAPDMSAWQELAARAGSANAGDNTRRQIVGWFYSDPAIGIFEPRIDFALIGQLLGESGALLLLIDPVANQGGFYHRQGSMFLETGGFYETGPNQAGPADIPWSGQVRGAAEWLSGSASVSTPVEMTVPIAPHRPGQNGPARILGSEATSPQAAPGAPVEEGEVLYLHRPARRDLATGPLYEELDADPALSRSVGHPPDRSGAQAAPYVIGTMPAGSFLATPAKRRSHPLVAAGGVLGVLIVAILLAAWLLPQLQSNTPSQIAPIPTALAQNGLQNTATVAPAAADLPGTPTASEATAPSSPPAANPTSEQAAATVPELPATATIAPAASVAQAQPEPSPTQAAGAGGSTPYTVKAGDSLSVIAKRYGTTTKAIMDANNLQSTLIRIGQVLVIPPPATPTP